ncbi:hypothetical protein KP509_18G011500 [Ceratopteris richardii]|uniref:DUF7869 domain-containing protein n=1 Tax=Ceratopteris richardii TaxID=49495 RepID=A0A8T2SMP7_CERRI|nr:hypothetical protein KP509_18G011500 [Ceratopteris richardii]
MFSVESFKLSNPQCNAAQPNAPLDLPSDPTIDLPSDSSACGATKKQSKLNLRFKRRSREVSRKRFKFLTSDRQIALDIVKHCCGLKCLYNLGMKKLKHIREKFLHLDSERQDIYLVSCMQMIEDNMSVMRVGFEYFFTQGMPCCRAAFKIAMGVGNFRIHRVQQGFLNGDLILDTFHVGTKGSVGRHAMNWMMNYFSLHCEVMPTTGRLHLSDNFTHREVFQIYREDMENRNEKYVLYRHFTRLWKEEFNNVSIPRKVRMGECSVCATLKNMAKGATTPQEKHNFKNLLNNHRDSQALERKKAIHHRSKALRNPERYMCLLINGMDQKKTCLPHFYRIPKDIGDEVLVQMHLVGALVYNGTVMSKVFFTYPNVHNDPNLIVTVIHRVLQSWKGLLPPTLYLQLDNTARENKNSTVFGYLSMLVEKQVFQKVKVNFLLVGHTHDHIDQMFSTFSNKLARNNAFTLPILSELISEAYTPKPEVQHLTQIYDFKHFCSMGLDNSAKVLAPLHNISFNHVFLMRRVDEITLLFAKQYSSSLGWEPKEGCRFLLQVPNLSTVTVYGAEQSPYEDKNNIERCGSVVDQSKSWMHALIEKKRHIERAKKYAGDQDVSWWEDFFNHQEEIIQYTIAGHWPVDVPFTWDFCTQRSVNVAQACNVDALQSFIHPPERNIYVGPRMTKQAEARWQGNLIEINVGTLIAVLADGDEATRPFWIAKVLEITKDIDQRRIEALVVHWYYTKSSNAFTGKYNLEMVCDTKRRGSKRKKNIRSTSTLKMDDVDILVYDFSLTKTGHLRKATINMIKQKLPDVCGTGNHRKTRRVVHDPAEFGMYVDEDRALVDIEEEEESSQQYEIESSASDDEGVDIDRQSCELH